MIDHHHRPHQYFCSLTQTTPETITIELGTDVAKDFVDDRGKSLGLYRGHIVDIDEDEEDGTVLYRVLYEDGDHEDLNEVECQKAIDLYIKLETGEINEWEIGGDE